MNIIANKSLKYVLRTGREKASRPLAITLKGTEGLKIDQCIFEVCWLKNNPSVTFIPKRLLLVLSDPD